MATPAPAQPLGPPGPWALVFEDTFGGTELDPANWTAVQGAVNSGVTTQASAVSVSGGYCRLLLGGMLCSNPASGFPGPASGPALAVGDCVEYRISFPGPSPDTGFNWAAAWASGPDWPAGGEQDWAEGYNGRLSALNYHSPAGASNGPFPPGSWFGAFHTFTGVRGEAALDCYWDGLLVRSVPRADDGSPQSLLVLIGAGNTASDTAETLVDYVRMWSPAPPPFPWPAGNYIGLESADPACHSGYSLADRPHVAAWQEQMSRRGWVITVSGSYDAASAAVAVLFQREKGLAADGKVGQATWMASWTAPVT